NNNMASPEGRKDFHGEASSAKYWTPRATSTVGALMITKLVCPGSDSSWAQGPNCPKTMSGGRLGQPAELEQIRAARTALAHHQPCSKT
ncbi:unnamed protein product, partial [Polarella glacialis]